MHTASRGRPAKDVIIQKLRWQRRKDLDDASNVIAVRFSDLDWDYLNRWTELHETSEQLKQLCDELPDIDLLRRL